MSEKLIADSRLAFKLYNKINASNDEIRKAKSLMENVDVNELDVYGKFVWAQIHLFRVYIKYKSKTRDAFEMFVQITQSKDTPKKVLVGAYYFVGRAYELGLGVERNRNHALENYLEANKLNNKVCLTDIARVTKALHPTKPQSEKGTPEEYRYKFYVPVNDDDLFDDLEPEVYRYRKASSADHLRRMKVLKRTGFYYEDEPEIVNLAELDLYCVDGVTIDDLTRAKAKPMRLDEYDEYGYEEGHRYANLEECLLGYSDDDDDDFEGFDMLDGITIDDLY